MIKATGLVTDSLEDDVATNPCKANGGIEGAVFRDETDWNGLLGAIGFDEQGQKRNPRSRRRQPVTQCSR